MVHTAKHPAEYIKAYLKARGITTHKLACEAGIPPCMLYMVVSTRNRRVTPSLAAKLEKAAGQEAYKWLVAQAKWDAEQKAKHASGR